MGLQRTILSERLIRLHVEGRGEKLKRAAHLGVKGRGVCVARRGFPHAPSSEEQQYPNGEPCLAPTALASHGVALRRGTPLVSDSHRLALLH